MNTQTSMIYTPEPFKPKDGEYQKDGLWYCGKCNEPVQHNAPTFGLVRVSCLCKKREKEAKAAKDEKEQKEQKRRNAFERAKTKRFDFTFANDDRRNEAATNALLKYCENFEKHHANGDGLILYSDKNGGGKTFLACAVANNLIDRGFNILVTDFLAIRDKLFNPTAFGHTSRTEVLNWLCSHALVVLDDLGAEQSNDFMLEVEYRTVDRLTDAGVPIILTTNYTLSDFKTENDINKRRVFDRILGSCALLSVEPPDGKSRRMERCKQLTKDILSGGDPNT